MWKPHNKNRDGMWEVIRELRTFTSRDIVTRTGHDSRTVNQYLGALLKGGYLKAAMRPFINKYGESPCKQKLYTLAKDTGRQRPVIDDEGKLLPPTARQRIWTALKVVGYSPFDWRDISLVAATDIHVAKEYCHFLTHAGYLRIVRESKPGTTAQYLFVRKRDTGPHAPEIRKRKTEVYDPNTHTVVWQKGAAA